MGVKGAGPRGSSLFTQYNISCTPPESVSCMELYGMFGSVTGFCTMLEMPPCHLPRRTGFKSYESSETGFTKDSVVEATVDRTTFINIRHIGATMSPETFFAIGVLSLFPAQVPTTTDGV